MMQYESWRSREVVWVKPFKNSKGEDCYRSKDGKMFPAEAFKRQYEKLEEGGTSS